MLKQDLTIVAAHGKQPLRHMMNIGWKKRSGAIFTGANGMNTGLQLTNQKNSEFNKIPQQVRPKKPNCQKKIIEYQFGISWKK